MSGPHWIEVGKIDGIPRRGARVVETPGCNIALFRTADDRIFALEDRCPHRNGPLSQGIVHGHKVTCPLHDWVIDLTDGEAQGQDRGCARAIAVKTEDDRIYLERSALQRLAFEERAG